MFPLQAESPINKEGLNMRKLLLVFLMLLPPLSANSITFYDYEFSGHGIIDDKDGYVNLREYPKLDSKIVNRLKNGTLVYCYNEGGRVNDFCYSSTPKGTGYIHTSRISKLSYKFKNKKSNNIYKLYNGNKIIKISHDSLTKYNSICLTNNNICIPSNKIEDLSDINIDTHAAYWDPRSGNIYITASNGTENNAYNVVWIISKDKKVYRWIYKAMF